MLAFRSRRLTITVVVAVTALVTALLVPAAWRSAGTDVAAAGEASSLLTMVNQARADNGLAPLDFASDLSAVAAERAAIMAKSGSLTHTPDLGDRVCCWSWIGENVAYAGSVQSLHDVLINSAPHRANILNSEADDVGVAVVRGDGQLWAAQVFRARSDADRSDDAASGSRDAERDAPGTAPSDAPSSAGTATTTAPPEPKLTRAQLLRQQLRNGLRSARQSLRADRREHGPLDPVRAAVRYSATLGQVSG